MSELQSAQRELRRSYRSASVGQIYAGVLWLVSAGSWLMASANAGVLVLLIGGFFIYPVTAVVSRLLGSSGKVHKDNPLREASVTIPIVGALGIPVAGAAALYHIEWFFPAFMVIMGAHYLPFSHLYGMRVFLAVGAGMWIAGMMVGLFARDLAPWAAAVTGLCLVFVGLQAAQQHRREFGSTQAESPA